MTQTTEEKIAAFKSRYESLAGKVAVVRDAEELLAALLDICLEKKAKRVVTADLPDDLLDGLKEVSSGVKIEVLAPPYPRDFLPNGIDEAELGVSMVEFAIADTGTLVELAVNDEVRLVSTLPDTHVAILPSDRLIFNIEDAADKMREFFSANPDGATVSFISGPSRSGDIEMRLTLGVHGPKESWVVIYHPDKD